MSVIETSESLRYIRRCGLSRRKLPNDPEAERAVIGLLLVGTTAREYLFSNLAESDFFTPSHGLVFAAIRDLYLKGRKADAVTVRDLLHSNGFTTVQASD